MSHGPTAARTYGFATKYFTVFLPCNERGIRLDRLALPLEGVKEPLGGGFELALAERASQLAFRQRGQLVLLYRLLPGMVVFVGRARIAGFRIDPEGSMLWSFDRYEPFATPPTSDLEAGSPSAKRLLTLAPERFAAIIEAGSRRPELPGHSEPPGRLFVNDAFLLVNDRVLALWNYRCAVTGRQFAARNGIHPQLAVVPIRPPELGGLLHVRNYLPMVARARRAFEAGALSIGPNLDFLIVPDRLDPETFASLRSEGTLLVPDDPGLRPDPNHLRWHRTHVFGAG